jgi:hypothetical protein
MVALFEFLYTRLIKSGLPESVFLLCVVSRSSLYFFSNSFVYSCWYNSLVLFYLVVNSSHRKLKVEILSMLGREMVG